MKRKGYIIEQIADLDNLREADRNAQAGKVKTNRYIRRHNMHAEENLVKLREMILNLDFPDNGYSKMELITEGGKVREIIKQPYYPWRILHHAIMLVIGPDIYNSMIYDTFACVKGKGLHFGVKRMKSFLSKDPKGTTWFVKTDFKKFYQSIPHELVIKSLERKYKDKKFIELMRIAILTYNSGEGIIKILQDEQRRKGLANRGLYESAAR